VTAPTLETARLTLRGHRREDFEAFHGMWTDPAVYRHILREAQSREANWNRFVRFAGHWPLLGYGFWVATEKPAGRVVGEVGFADFQREIKPAISPRIEMGWVFARAVHGKGVASEAMGAVMAWGTSNLPTQQLACIVSPENAPSIRLAEKFGFKKSHEALYQANPINVYHCG
jgi:RimJ/RimL family protein N-acetyltransferase